MSGMNSSLTRDDLAKLLSGISVADVAREAEISPKTIYRLRHRQNSPNLETVEKIVAAIRRIKAVEPDQKAA